MYEETDKNELFSILLKIVIAMIALIFILWIFKKSNDSDKIENTKKHYYFTLMNEATRTYFNNNNLPSKNGDTIKLSLDRLINERAINDFTKKDKTCNKIKSYIQVTKINNDEYSLKINLNCSNKDNINITTIKSN